MVKDGTHGGNADSLHGEGVAGDGFGWGEGDTNLREMLTRQPPLSVAGI